MNPTSLNRRMALTGAGALAAGGLIGAHSASAAVVGQLVFLNLGGNKVMNVKTDGTGLTTLVNGGGSAGPDGVTFDEVNNHIFWTNMGRADANDGTIIRCDFNGGNVTNIVPAGGTFTPKQMKYDGERQRLYWCDREGMRVMRCNPDGSNIEVLVQTGDAIANKGDASRWCVGIALDLARNQIFWSQKGGDNAGVGTIKRCNMEIPYGETATNRTDIKTMFSGLPEPIDMEIDPRTRRLYWTDRGDNTVSRAPLDIAPDVNPAARTDREILVRGLKEAIGITLDLPRKRMYYTSLGGEVGSANMDGTDAKMLLTGQGSLTGIALLVKTTMD